MSDSQIGEEDEQMPELVNLAENDDVIMFDDLLNEVEEEEEKIKEEDNEETDKKVEEKACYYGSVGYLRKTKLNLSTARKQSQRKNTCARCRH